MAVADIANIRFGSPNQTTMCICISNYECRARQRYNTNEKLNHPSSINVSIIIIQHPKIRTQFFCVTAN